jgi:Uma2 family endonuclease
MSSATWVRRSRLTLVDLARFGPMPLDRIRFDPWPGEATEQDVINIHEREKLRYELIDGILVEKVMGFRESMLAIALAAYLMNYLAERKLGIVAGSDGMFRLAPGLVRIPEVSFVSWGRFPNRQIPDQPIPDLAPDLAIEVLSPSNTQEEMERKLREYFDASVLVVWFVDRVARTVTVYTAPNQFTVPHEDQDLDGGALLPGFSLPLRQLFEEPQAPVAPPN